MKTKTNILILLLTIFITSLLSATELDPTTYLEEQKQKYINLDYKTENIKAQNTGFYGEQNYDVNKPPELNILSIKPNPTVVDNLSKKMSSSQPLSKIRGLGTKDRIIRNQLQYQCGAEKELFGQMSRNPNLLGILGGQLSSAVGDQAGQIANNMSAQIVSVFESMSKFLSPEFVLEQIFKTYQKQIASQTCKICRAGNKTGCGGVFLIGDILKSPAVDGAENQMLNDKAKMTEKEEVWGNFLEYGLFSMITGKCPDDTLVRFKSGIGMSSGTRTFKRESEEVEMFTKSTRRSIDDYMMEQCIISEEQKAKAWLNQVINTIISSVDARQESVENCLEENSDPGMLLMKNLTGREQLKSLFFNNINKKIGEGSIISPVRKSSRSKIIELTDKPTIYRLAGMVDMPKPATNSGNENDKITDDITKQVAEILSETTSVKSKTTKHLDEQITNTAKQVELAGYSSTLSVMIKELVSGIVNIKKMKYNSQNYTPENIQGSLGSFTLKLKNAELLPQIQKEFSVVMRDFPEYEREILEYALNEEDSLAGEICIAFGDGFGGDSTLEDNCLEEFLSGEELSSSCVCNDMAVRLPPFNNLKTIEELMLAKVKKKNGDSSCDNCGVMDEYRASLNGIREEYIKGTISMLKQTNIKILKRGLLSSPKETMEMRKYIRQKTILLD